MKLTITQAIIDRSKRSSASQCILANAGQDATGLECMVTRECLYVFDKEDRSTSYPLTKEAHAVVLAWDMGKTVSPCVLDLPDVEG